MSTPLRVLVVEDIEDDATLMLRALRHGGYTPSSKRVASEAEMSVALDRHTWDIILCDYVLPNFSGLAAIELLQKKDLDVPIIIVSGEISHEVAVGAMKAGAHDYIMKGNLTRLLPAIERELREAEVRHASRQGQAALQRSEARLAAIIASGMDAIISIDSNRRIVVFNPAAEEMFRCTAAEAIGQPLDRFIPPQFRGPHEKHIRSFGKSEVGARRMGVRQHVHAVRADGQEFPIEAAISQTEAANEMLYTAVVRDLSDRKQAENERARLSAAIEQAAESIMITDSNGKIVYVNPACERLTEYDRAELHGQTSRLLWDDRDDSEGRRLMLACLARGEIWSGSDVQRSKRGRLYELEVTVSPVRDSAGRIINYVGIGRDVSHERQVEAQLREAQKLEALGQLAGGVAHDFNNQLTVIKGSTQFLLSGLAADAPLRRDAERINETVDRGAHLVRQLLTFSRRQPIATQSLNLSELLNEVWPVLRLLVGEQITLRISAAPDLWPVRASSAEIERLLINLALNARDAILSRAAAERAAEEVITLQTANLELGTQTQQLAEQLPPGAYVVLVVSDTGVGVAPEVRERIFEPFFTTKESGKGTGLGLATVFGIVKQHGGAISCHSEPGKGTTFRIHFPRDETDEITAAKADTHPRPGTVAAGENRTVLVAEDEESVREVVRLALQESGYRVLDAGAVEEALAIAAMDTNPIDLLVTDMEMPGGSGQMLARHLRESYPKMRVLFVSGYYTDLADLAELPNARLIQKPFGLDDFLQTVGEMLPT